MTIFTETAERAKAMGVFSFVLSGGATAGVLGGVLTDLLAWNWIFLVNLPVGITVFVLSLRLLPDDRSEAGDRRLDVGGAVTVTAAVMLGTYAVINGNENGWTSGETVGLLAVHNPARRLPRARVEGRLAADAARVVSPAQHLGRQCRRHPLGGIDVRVVLFGALPPARARLHPARGWPRLPAVDTDHGRRPDRALRPARDALRRQATDRRRALLLCHRPALVRAGAR